MKARLSSQSIDMSPDPGAGSEGPSDPKSRPLQELRTRDSSDPCLAFIDAWATVADVLTFYQERIANEGYLRTATERRSILELARLIGYALRPGVAASAWLALELDKGYELKLQPNELKAQSVPGPGQTPQVFENIEAIDSKGAWNVLRPRLTRPQTRASLKGSSATDGWRIYLAGISSNLKANDPLLIEYGDRDRELFRVKEVLPYPAAGRTLVELRKWAEPAAPVLDRERLASLVKELREATGFDVSLGTQVAKRVQGHLGELGTALEQHVSDQDIIRLIEDQVLPKLSEEHRIATQNIRLRRYVDWTAAAVDSLKKVVAESGQAKPEAPVSATLDPMSAVLPKLTARPSVPPRNALALSHNLKKSFELRADTNLQLLSEFRPELGGTLPAAVEKIKVADKNPLRAYAFRVKGGPFGQNAPRRILALNRDTGVILKTGEWPIIEYPPDEEKIEHEVAIANVLYLDANQDKISPDSWIVVDGTSVPKDSLSTEQIRIRLAETLLIARALRVQADLSRADYGMSGKTTRIELDRAWLKIDSPEHVVLDQVQADYDKNFKVIRNTSVYAASEELELAEEPIEEDICEGGKTWVELDGIYSGLKPGRWLIVSGERADVVDASGATVTGIPASELVMLSESIQAVAAMDAESKEATGRPLGGADDKEVPLPGDRIHTFIKLAKDLEYCYRREAVTIYGNVVKATHGETRREVLGNGNGSQPFQSFTLKQPPVTYVASPSPAGAENTLRVYVNDAKWHEAASLSDRKSDERIFTTKTDDQGKTTVIFGDGQHGLRLPTGMENVRAVYRNQIGKAGNVGAGQISQLMSRPLGMKGVSNPQRASGGADREGRDTARKNAPRTVTALDRLVSVSDYADFACTFAGIGKALAARITDGKRRWVHLTIAGIDDIPIDETSDLYRNLLRALHDFGDPYQPVFVQVRELLLLLVKVNVSISSDYQWETVAPAVRAKLLDVFSFERRELGQDLYLSEVIAAIQSVRGVAYADVDVLGGIPEKISEEGVRRPLTPREISEAAAAQFTNASQPWPRLSVNLADFEDGEIRPAQLSYLSPDVAETLVINQVER